MNLWILLALIGMAISSPYRFLGIITGILLCYIFLDGRGENSSIKYHLTHWSWFDIKV